MENNENLTTNNEILSFIDNQIILLSNHIDFLMKQPFENPKFEYEQIKVHLGNQINSNNEKIEQLIKEKEKTNILLEEANIKLRNFYSKYEKTQFDFDLINHIQMFNKKLLEGIKVNFFNFYNLCDETCSHLKIIHVCEGNDLKCNELCLKIKCNLKCCKLSMMCKNKEDHDCKYFSDSQDHLCNKNCSECEKKNIEVKCSFGAGHNEEFHLCYEGNHKCDKKCSFFNKNNCNKKCIIPLSKPHSMDECLCDEKIHNCLKPCEKIGCQGKCMFVYGHPQGDHLCKQSCIEQCKMCQERGGNSKCTKNHKHTNDEKEQNHQCSESHTCKSLCENEGVCNIKTECGIEKPCKENGWKYQTSQRGEKLSCAIKIRPNEIAHKEKHKCSINENLHQCGKMCKQCLYLCQNAVHKLGLCKTNHGTMGNTFLKTITDKNIELKQLDKKFEKFDEELTAYGKVNGFDLTCMENCVIFGRGHTHPIIKEDNTFEYMSCKEYFENFLKFEQISDNNEYNLCGFKCAHPSHQTKNEVKYCLKSVLHEPFKNSDQNIGNNCFISKDGHIFDCSDHIKFIKDNLHLIAFLDASGSMDSKNLLPEKKNMFLNNVYGTVLECFNLIVNQLTKKYGDKIYLSHINFTENCKMLVKREKAYENMIIDKKINDYFEKGGTSFNTALKEAIKLLKEYKNDMLVLMFLSDGQDKADDKILEDLKKVLLEFESNIIVIGVGVDDKELQKIAKTGENKGIYKTVRDNFDLKQFLLNDIFSSIGYAGCGFYVETKKK